MSKIDIWMPLYIADYLADTTRLTTEQHGAYLLLIMDYWRNGPLPDDDTALENITRLSSQAWKKNRAAMARMFRVSEGEWRHKRIDEELALAASNSEKYSERAKKAAAKRWGNQCKSDATSNATSSSKAVLNECTSPSPSSIKAVDQAAAVHPEPDAAALPPIDPITSRAIELSCLLTQRGAALQASNPKVRAWAEQGITDAQALTALEIGEQRRVEQANPQPVNAGLIDSILSDVTKPNARASPPRNGRQSRIDNYAAEAAAARGEHGQQHSTGRTERDITGESIRVA